MLAATPIAERLEAALAALGIGRGSTVLIHSSFRRLSAQGHRPEDFLDALVAHLPAGTLLLPAMSWRSVNPQNPVFDELATPSITGILGELFRGKWASRRSLHPTHSVAGCGALADYLLGEHHIDETPCSKRSPFGRLVEVDGVVVLLGVGMERCTLIHHFEELVAPDRYLETASRKERYICRDRHGAELVMHTRRHLRLERDFQQFLTALDRRKRVRHHLLDGVSLIGFRAKEMAELVVPWLEREPEATLARPGATNPGSVPA
jgi:aminoglycoside 3-N-acetyltransferase